MKLWDLFERKRPTVDYAFHGTSSVFMRSILKHGLLPNPPQRMFGDEPDEDKEDLTSIEALPRVYLSQEFHGAWTRAKETSSKFGGKPIVVIVQYTKLSTNVDEDDIYEWFQNLFDSIEMDGSFYGIESPGMYEFLDDFFFDRVSEDTIDALKDAFEDQFRTSRDAKILEPILKIMKIIASTITRKHSHWRGWLNDIKKSTYWDEFREALFKLTNIVGGRSNTNDLLTTDQTFTISRPIGFRGKTKIIGILGGPKENPKILWGVTPDNFIL